MYTGHNNNQQVWQTAVDRWCGAAARGAARLVKMAKVKSGAIVIISMPLESQQQFRLLRAMTDLPSDEFSL